MNTIQSEAKQLCDDASKFFNYSHDEMQTIDRKHLINLQLAGLQYRFHDLRDRIPMLKKLAEKQGIEKLESIDDVIPLLFEHTMYKSYPPSLLEKNRFTDIMRWMNKLVSIDLLEIDVSQCQSIDEWIAVLDAESPLSIVHSSGTSGTMSFIPCSKRERDKIGEGMKVQVTQFFGTELNPEADEAEIYAIYPYFRSGASAHLRGNDGVVKFVVGSEERFIAAYPTRMSSDVLYLAAKVSAAQAKGELDRLEISPDMLARKAEYEELQAKMPEHLDQFFESALAQLAGKRIYLQATWNILHSLAKQALDKGLSNVFAPDSIILSGGGSKGMVPPENWEEDVKKFVGSNNMQDIYGMSEVGAGFMRCDQGHYHMAPWVIPILLDPDTSEPLPRKGVVIGRACFFDLGAETRWGGFITGDEVTMNWDEPCTCGRTSVYLIDGIRRFSEKQGGDDKISCAATENAHKEAMSFLTSFE